MIRTYSQLIQLPTFEQRYEYCRCGQKPTELTFGASRWLNQIFYNSSEWRNFRRQIILRDNGNDLGVEGFQIPDIPRKSHTSGNPLDCYGIIIHHLNPITEYDILNRAECLLDPENVICVSAQTHNAIHYGSKDILPVYTVIERRPGDTKLW